MMSFDQTSAADSVEVGLAGPLLRIKKMTIQDFSESTGVLGAEDDPWNEPLGFATVPPWEADSSNVCCA